MNDRKFEINNIEQWHVKTPELPNWGFRNKLLGQIEPIENGGINFQGSEDISRHVEWPCREACQIFFNKNIKTELSGANKNNVDSASSPHIILDFKGLSGANKKIATQFGRLVTDSSGNAEGWVVLNVSVGKHTTAGAVRDHFMEMAEQFKVQE